MESSVWFGVIGPAGMSPEIVMRVNRAFAAALKKPEIAKRMQADDYTTELGTSPGEFAAFIKSEMDAWGPVIRRAGITIQ